MTLILDEVLRAKNISLTELSKTMTDKGHKLSRVSLSNIVNKNQSPKLETLEAIADTLGISILELFDSTPPDYKTIYEKDEEGNFIEVGYLKK